MISSVNIHSDVAVYMQIENHVKFAIASGKLKSGDQLPAIRDLAERINVNTNTVAKAYRDLEVMGLVYGRRGTGVFVRKGVQAKCREMCFGQIAQRLYEVTQEAKAAAWNRSDITKLVNACHEAKDGPYDEVPKTVLKLAK